MKICKDGKYFYEVCNNQKFCDKSDGKIEFSVPNVYKHTLNKPADYSW